MSERKELEKEILQIYELGFNTETLAELTTDELKEVLQKYVEDHPKKDLEDNLEDLEDDLEDLEDYKTEKIIESGFDPKVREVLLVQKGNKYRVLKPSINYYSPFMSKKIAQLHFDELKESTQNIV